jgi:DNA polymerase-3 subunit gamma/tau
VRLDVEVDLVLDPSLPSGQPAPGSAAAPDPAPAQPSRPEESGPSARERAAAVVAEENAPEADDDVSVDDPDAEGDLSGIALVQRELGGTVMTEYDNS